MFAVIDCGTTNTRVYLIDHSGCKVAEGARRVGVRNTSMTGSKQALRDGVREAVSEAAQHAGISPEQIEFAITSGMITSEIGLLEIPHLVAPAGLQELAAQVCPADGKEIIGLNIPLLFIRGVRNDYGEGATLRDIRKVDFMRGEETQVIGILDEFGICEAVNILVLSSHTKLIHVDAHGRIRASLTTISGQLYEAVQKQTMIGKSLEPVENEPAGSYNDQEVIEIASQVAQEAGLDRCLMIPRFMQVLLQTDYRERNLFLNAAIAADDMKGIEEFERQGYSANSVVLFGHPNRCSLYAHMLHVRCGEGLRVIQVSDPEKLAELTVRGAVLIASRYQSQNSKE